MDQEYKGKCFCGTVEVAVKGSPEAMGYCHCDSCRGWAAAPVNAFTLWKTDSVRITKGKDSVGEFHRSETSHRQFCKKCGGHLMTAHPHWGLIDVYAAIIPGLRFEPKVHVHYASKVVPMQDGLPKFRDVPADMGGTGETMAE